MEDRVLVLDDHWKTLVQSRNKFLSQQLIKQTLAFAKGQIHQAKAKKQSAKKIYNAVRLLHEAERFANGKEPKIWMEGTEREFIMEVRYEKHEFPFVQTYLEKLEQKIDSLKPWKLPEELSESELNAWLLTLRKDHLKEPYVEK